jgi:hypothetical protein
MTAASVCREQLAGIVDAVRIELAAYPTHQGGFGRVAGAFQIGALDLTDAVLGRDAAAVFFRCDGQWRGRPLALCVEVCVRQFIRLQLVDRQVAVADMAVSHYLELRILARQQRLHLVHEGRHFADAHRYIVFVGHVWHQTLGDAFAQAPRSGSFRLASRDHAIADPAAFHTLAELSQRCFLRSLVCSVILSDA